ncbi:MAG: hypothetical protein LQ352_005980 [Teloschistes flavicans]|nr:MAG: hypothetical protein LQ352_005980 [Teloschistes flavicans]
MRCTIGSKSISFYEGLWVPSLEVRYHAQLEEHLHSKSPLAATVRLYMATSFGLELMDEDDPWPRICVKRKIRNECITFEKLVKSQLAEATRISAELAGDVSSVDDPGRDLAPSLGMWKREMELLHAKAKLWVYCAQTMH